MKKIKPFVVVATKDTSQETLSSYKLRKFSADGKTWIVNDFGEDHSSPYNGKTVAATSGRPVDLEIEESACFGVKCQSCDAISVLLKEQVPRKIDRCVVCGTRMECLSGRAVGDNDPGGDGVKNMVEASIRDDASDDAGMADADDDDPTSVAPADSVDNTDALSLVGMDGTTAAAFVGGSAERFLIFYRSTRRTFPQRNSGSIGSGGETANRLMGRWPPNIRFIRKREDPGSERKGSHDKG